MKRFVAKFYSRYEKKKKWSIIIVIFALILSYILFMTPFFSAMVIRFAFSMTEQSPPLDYEEISRKVTVYSDVAYPSEYGRNILDIYLPKDSDRPLTTIIWMHGGGYVGGDKKETKYFATSLAAKGYAVVSFNYELAPKENYPAPLIQLGEVCAFIKSEHMYPFDTKRLVFAGSSVGAHCTAQFISIQASKEYADLIGIKQTVPLEYVKAVLLYCGPYNFEKIGTQSQNRFLGFMTRQAMWAYFGEKDWRDQYGQSATIPYHVTTAFPPTFLTDGNTGSFEEDAKELEKTLENLSVPVESYYIDVDDKVIGNEYQYDMHTPAAEEAFLRTLTFLEKHLKRT